MSGRTLSPTEIESRAKQAGLSMAEVCRRAKVAASTFHRWKSGDAGLTVGSYTKLLDAIDGREQTESEQSNQRHTAAQPQD